MNETKAQASEMPPMVVDRSPELARSSKKPEPAGRTMVDYAIGASLEDYIKGAVPGSGEFCPLANFLREKMPGCIPNISSENPHYIRPNGTRVDLHLSPEIVEEIGKFDRGDPSAFKDVCIDWTGW